jgi:hypothetical protein
MTKASEPTNQAASVPASKPSLAVLAVVLGLIIVGVMYAKIIGL